MQKSLKSTAIMKFLNSSLTKAKFEINVGKQLANFRVVAGNMTYVV